VVEHLAGLDDHDGGRGYRAAVESGPKDKITLRQGARGLIFRTGAMKLLAILAVLLASATPASVQEAYWRQTWECGKLVTVELRKYGTAAYELTFSGALIVTSPTGKPITGINLKWVGRDGAILNGKRCKKVPEGQEQ
jgi:hypothetical protein